MRVLEECAGLFGKLLELNQAAAKVEVVAVVEFVIQPCMAIRMRATW